jgi:alanine racemase
VEIEEAVRPSWMEIDLAALAHNVRTLRSNLVAGTQIIAALKGDAYGHGIAPVARCLAACGVESLATGSLRDASAIREAGVDLPILMFAGPLPEGIPALIDRELTPTVHNWTSALAVSNAAKQPTGVYIKVDSGLGRLGVPLSDARHFVHQVSELANVRVDGVYTHLSFHDEAERDWARERYAAFDALLDALDTDGIDIPVTQALASAGLISGLSSRANAVCPGSLLYGMCPVDEDIAVTSGYRPVVRAIKSRLIHIGEPGDPRHPARVGVVPLGLADGYQKIKAEAAAYALLAGRRVPIRGVSLEYIELDLSNFDKARVGNEVVLMGESGSEQILMSDIASWQGLSLHAVMLSFEGRLPARYLGGATD